MREASCFCRLTRRRSCGIGLPAAKSGVEPPHSKGLRLHLSSPVTWHALSPGEARFAVNAAMHKTL